MTKPRTKRGTFATKLSPRHEKELRKLVRNTVVEDIFAWLDKNYPKVDIRTKYTWIKNALR